MKFRTEYTATPCRPRLSVLRPVTLIGSCFSDNIGALMRRDMWDARVNPCGVVYNPASIRRIVATAVDGGTLPDPILRDGMYVSPLLSSKVYGATPGQCDAAVRTALRSLRQSIADSQAVIVTLGTARVYTLAGRPSEVVTNCHKRPSREFDIRMLTPGEAAGCLADTAAAIRRLNPACGLIFTVSPVRHLGDGFTLNTISKSTLHLAAHLAAESLGEDAAYFAAYEIMCDDLRDYRFYASDLAHPSAEAAEYIYGQFLATHVSDDHRSLLAEARGLRAALTHRPQLPSPAHERHLAASRKRLAAFLAAHRGMQAGDLPREAGTAR